MNDADKRAFEDWKVEQFQKGEPILSPSKAWQAACEWRDSQVGEPVAWAAPFIDGELCELFQDLETLKLWMVSEDCMWDVKITPLYTTPPAAQINQQLVDAAQKVVDTRNRVLHKDIRKFDHEFMELEAALAAAKETK